MKKSILLACAATLLAASTSCESKSRLASDIEGAWESSPERVLNDVGVSATVVRNLSFERKPDSNGGTVTLTADYTIVTAIPGPSVPEVNVPIQLTASGTATITGQWAAADDDKIVLTLDPSTVSISVDPDGVTLVYSEISGSSSPLSESLKPAAANLTHQQIATLINNDAAAFSEIDDIKFHDGGMMQCEVGHADLTFRRAQ